jgi:membrane-bound serine protease (ClpP class)
MNSKVLRLVALLALPICYLLFRPYMIEWAEDWEWITLIVGVFLLGLEVFIIPGFGITGITAFLFMYAGLVFVMLNNKGADFSQVTTADLTRALLIGGVLLGVVLLALLAVIPTLLNSSTLQNIAHNSSLEKPNDFVELRNLPKMIGKTGVAETILRPSGKIIIENQVFDATTQGDFIPKGATIKVIEQDGSALRVKQA